MMQADQDQLNVLIADGTDLTRRGIRDVLESQPGVRVVGEARSIAAAIEGLRVHRPEVVLLDVMLADGPGLEVCAAVRNLELDTRILVLANDSDAERVREYVDHGAAGYVLKSASSDEIWSAILDVAAGKMTFSPDVADKVRALMASSTGHSASFKAIRDRLTQRESEVLEQLEYGLRNREIATTLGISKKTVETHVRNVLLKLGVNTRTQAVVRALRA